MAPQTSQNELISAWRALTGNPDAEGWRTIPVAVGGPCSFRAGRRFPGNEEALLVGFASIRVPKNEQLPKGRGFTVSLAALGMDQVDRVWIALCRQSAGKLDFFAMMAEDVMCSLQGIQDIDHEKLFHIFLGRIRAWQDFMQRSGDGLLSPEAEVGLFGELEILRTLISAGFPTTNAIESWKGPLDGVQDFTIGTGAIEVKSTVSSSGFRAQVSSLDQLDDSLIRPLFLAGIRLTLAASGRTLSEQIASVQAQLGGDLTAHGLFESRLIHAGYLFVEAERYTRKFFTIGIRMIQMSASFPRLTHANVPLPIRQAHYEIDLDLLPNEDVEFENALRQLGAI